MVDWLEGVVLAIGRLDWFEAIVTAGTVVLGVVLARWLEHRGELWQQLRTDVTELTGLMTYVAAGYVASDGSMDTGLNSEWWQRRDRVFLLIARIRAAATALRPRAKDVLEGLDAFVVRLGAAEQRFIVEGRHIPKLAVLELGPEELRKAVMPGGDPPNPQPEIQRLLSRWDRGEQAVKEADE